MCMCVGVWVGGWDGAGRGGALRGGAGWGGAGHAGWLGRGLLATEGEPPHQRRILTLQAQALHSAGSNLPAITADVLLQAERIVR